MPKALIRYQQAGDLHFVTFSCYRRQLHLGTAHARDIFERSLEAMRLRYDFFIAGYVVMPEHVHLLLSEPKKTILAKALQALKLSGSVQRNERPFCRHAITTSMCIRSKRVEKLQYMHRNPVKRGLVAEPEDWAWSSCRHYWTDEDGVVEIESLYTAARRDRAAMKAHVSEARHGAPTSVEVI